MASALALSPSVIIRVHLSALRFPASFASSNFVMPSSLQFFWPFITFASLASSLAFDWAKIISTIPEFLISLRNLSVKTHLEPKAETFVVRNSLVCVSKVGFSMRQLQKMNRCCFIWLGLIWEFFPAFFLICSIKLSQIWSAMWFTWFPPRIVQMEFTKETWGLNWKFTWLKFPSLKLTATSHLSVVMFLS